MAFQHAGTRLHPNGHTTTVRRSLRVASHTGGGGLDEVVPGVVPWTVSANLEATASSWEAENVHDMHVPLVLLVPCPS